MSEYFEFEGLGDSGAEPGGDFSALLGDAPDFDLGFEYHAADVHDGLGVFDNEFGDAEDDTSESTDPTDLADLVDAGTYGNLLDGLDFNFDDVDLAGLVEGAFDLIGSDPDESGWWEDLASENSHDGVYDEVSADLDTNPYVTR